MSDKRQEQAEITWYLRETARANRLGFLFYFIYLFINTYTQVDVTSPSNDEERRTVSTRTRTFISYALSHYQTS